MPITVYAPGNVTVQFPDGTDGAVIGDVMMKQFGGGAAAAKPGGPWEQYATPDNPAPAGPWTKYASNEQPSMAGDIAKSAGIGLAKGAIGLAGLPGDAPGALEALADYGNRKAVEWGVPGAVPRNATKFQNPLPGAADIQAAIESKTGKFYEPQTTAGQYAQTIGEFAPAAIGGPETLGARLMRMVTPAVASEAAGQSTAGTAIEPWARAAGAVVGGKASSLATRPAAAAAPTIAELRDAARAGYRSPEVAAVEIHPQAVSDLATKIENDLVGNGFRPTAKLGADTFREARALDVPPNVASVKVADIDNARRALGNLAKEVDAIGQPTTEAAAATRAIEHIDDFLPNLRQADLLAGDARRANAILSDARGDWGAARRAETVANAVERADLNAAVANSGQNIDNATRQRIKGILQNPKLRAGFSPAEQLQMHQIARGTVVGNLSRAVGNLLGGGGGLGAVVSAAAGAHALGPAGLVAPLAGFAAKKVGNASTARGVAALDEMVRARSPLARAAVAAQPAAVPQLTPMQQRLIAAALGVQSGRP